MNDDNPEILILSFSGKARLVSLLSEQTYLRVLRATAFSLNCTTPNKQNERVKMEAIRLINELD